MSEQLNQVKGFLEEGLGIIYVLHAEVLARKLIQTSESDKNVDRQQIVVNRSDLCRISAPDKASGRKSNILRARDLETRMESDKNEVSRKSLFYAVPVLFKKHWLKTTWT